MTSGVFSLISYIPAGTIGVNQASPALSPVGETAGVSIGISYWTQFSVSNSGTTSFDLPYSENSTQNTADFSLSTSLNSADSAVASGTIGYRYYYSGSTITLYGLVIPADTVTLTDSSGDIYEGYSVGVVTVSISTASGNSAWSYTFNKQDLTLDGNINGYVEVSPSWSLSSTNPLTFSITITETNDGYPSSLEDPSWSLPSSSSYTYSGSSGTNQIITSSPPSQASIGFVTGWKFDSQSTSFTIPQYESSFDVTWSSSPSSNPTYNGQSPTGTSGTLTGTLGSNTITVNPLGDPPDVSNSASTYSFSYYLSSQNQVTQSTAGSPETSAPTYT